MIGLLATASELIQLLGGVLILRARWAVIRQLLAGRASNDAVERARHLLAGGVVGALGMMTAATLLYTRTLQSWQAIGMFAAILALRTLVKRSLSRAAEA